MSTRKIHLLLTKEHIRPDWMDERKIAVVFDVLLATSTIVSCLSFGAKKVYPAFNEEKAIALAQTMPEGSSVLASELDGKTIKGFTQPTPLYLRKNCLDKHVILASTNGTVAIGCSSGAHKTYIGSIMNIEATAQSLMEDCCDRTIMIVCAGSAGNFCMEDFLGSGLLLQSLSTYTNLLMNDAAMAAYCLAGKKPMDITEVLKRSKTGRMLVENGYGQDIEWIAKQNAIPFSAILDEDGFIRKKEEKHTDWLV
ncbi:2-phosphosulfolactate phosphatase [Bacillus sp. 1P06AnD]|uniref:2-phosphosulfolactate phosphatase n=1 Tax=Bacillus sp. 1P06AnD TaxID=3132208 RepID=UPI0039A1DD4E